MTGQHVDVQYRLNFSLEDSLCHALKDAGAHPAFTPHIIKCDEITASVLNVLLGHLPVSYIALEKETICPVCGTAVPEYWEGCICGSA